MTLVTASVGISRPSTTDLVIANTGTTYRLASLGRPSTTWRSTFMPDSPDIEGSELLNAVKETSALPFGAFVYGSSVATLEANIDALTSALDQLFCNATVTVGGFGRVWASAGPAAYGSFDGQVDPGRVAAFFDVLTITIPVQPTPGSVA